MHALDRKLLRDLRLMWSQALTIALVVAAGVGGFLTSLSAVDSLAAARDAFYAEGAFAELFVDLKRAPRASLEAVQRLPGVADAQARSDFLVRMTVPGSTDPVIGQLIGLDARPGAERMNRVVLRRGQLPAATPAAGGAIEALVSEAFATAHGLRPGDTLGALVNGKRRTLVVSGIALSPEFIFAGLWGMPDARAFGVFWIDADVLAAAYDMAGAYNRLAVKVAPGAPPQAVAEALAGALAPYGARSARDRSEQTSHAMLQSEIDQQRVMGTVLPAIFLGVAAFLLNVVVSRLVATQREQIAALKALGYPNAAIAAHYLKLVLVIVGAGLALGLWVGDALGAQLTALYTEFFRFPRFEHVMPPGLVLASTGVAVATAVLGTLGAILATVRLTPAEAMRPPAPGHFGPLLIERLGWHGLARRLSPGLRMILRQMERRPLRSGLAIVGMAAAVAIVVLGNFFRDAIEVIVDTTFRQSMRGHVSVWHTDPGPAAVQHALARLPGVLEVEALRDVPVTLVHGHRHERANLRGFVAEPSLFRIIDLDGHVVRPSADGLLMTDRLADKLGLRVGDVVSVRIDQGRDRTVQLPVTRTLREMMGLNVYLERRALNRVLGEGDVTTGYTVALEPGSEPAFLAATQGLPRIAGAFSKASMLRNMEEISARNVRIMSTVLTLFASVIAVGVVYNNARIALAERGWELASLRVLGLTRGEVAALLLGELAIGIALAIPLGMALGWLLVHGIGDLMRNDQFDFPLVIRPRTYAIAALAVVAAGAASAWAVRRRIDRLDLVGALKTRE